MTIRLMNYMFNLFHNLSCQEPHLLQLVLVLFKFNVWLGIGGKGVGRRLLLPTHPEKELVNLTKKNRKLFLFLEVYPRSLYTVCSGKLTLPIVKEKKMGQWSEFIRQDHQPCGSY